MPRGRNPGLTIPTLARAILRDALVREGERLARLPDARRADPLVHVAWAHSVSGSHLYRCLAPDRPSKNPSRALAVGLLDTVPATVREQIREIAQAAGETALVSACDSAASGPLRPRRMPKTGVPA